MADQVPGTKMVEVAPPPPPTQVALPPVPITLIGTKKDDIPTIGTIMMTAGPGQPNAIVQGIITPFVAIVVRVAFMFAKSLLGFVTLAAIPPGTNPVLLAIHGMDFYHIVVTAAGMAIAPTGIDLIQSLVTILGKLEQKYPLATGSI